MAAKNDKWADIELDCLAVSYLLDDLDLSHDHSLLQQLAYIDMDFASLLDAVEEYGEVDWCAFHSEQEAEIETVMRTADISVKIGHVVCGLIKLHNSLTNELMFGANTSTLEVGRELEDLPWDYLISTPLIEARRKILAGIFANSKLEFVSGIKTIMRILVLLSCNFDVDIKDCVRSSIRISEQLNYE